MIARKNSVLSEIQVKNKELESEKHRENRYVSELQKKEKELKKKLDEQTKNISITGIMNYLQDCSTFHSEDVGGGLAYLNEHHQAWWLSSWQIVIDRYPRLGERIVMGTWPYERKGIYAYRNFTIQDLKGGYLVRANSVWFLFDTKAGRPVRVKEEDVKRYGGPEERLAMDYAPRKIALPENYEEREPVL